MREGSLLLYHLVHQRMTLVIVVAAVGVAVTLLLLAVSASLADALVPAPETLFTAPFRWQQAGGQV